MYFAVRRTHRKAKFFNSAPFAEEITQNFPGVYSQSNDIELIPLVIFLRILLNSQGRRKHHDFRGVNLFFLENDYAMQFCGFLSSAEIRATVL